MSLSRRFILVAFAGALALPGAAAAHVTVQPPQAAAGAFTVLNLRVPNESEDASTVKVDLQLPDGFALASYEPKPGWSVKVARERLSPPVQTPDGELTEQVSRITWTGSGRDGRIAPGEFMDFPISVRIPETPGEKLVFKSLQTYSDNEVVRWIGAADSDKPAAIVNVTAPGEDGQDAPPATTGATPAAPPVAANREDEDEDDDDDDLAMIAALGLGGLGFLMGAGALVVARRK